MKLTIFVLTIFLLTFFAQIGWTQLDLLNEFIIVALEQTQQTVNELDSLTEVYDQCTVDTIDMAIQNIIATVLLELRDDKWDEMLLLATGRDLMILNFFKPYNEARSTEAQKYLRLHQGLLKDISCTDPVHRLFGRMKFIKSDVGYLLDQHRVIKRFL